MKKRHIFLIVLCLVLIIVVWACSCKKTKALESELFYQEVNITSHNISVDDCGAVFLFDIAKTTVVASADFLLVNGYTYNFNITDTNYLRLFEGNTTLQSVLLTSRTLEILFTIDQGSLFIYAYQIDFDIQEYQGDAPSINGIHRTMLFRQQLNQTCLDLWDSQAGLSIRTTGAGGNYRPNFLLNYSYLDLYECITPDVIHTWCDKQLSNFTYIQKLLTDTYDRGYSEGDAEGFVRGRNQGYSNGYSVGYQDGLIANNDELYQSAYDSGYTDGIEAQNAYQVGYDAGRYDGYLQGYEEAEGGATPLSKVSTLISSIMAGVGAVLSVQLMPGISIGIFILVPLFFAVLGLILWIWRRN